MRVTEVIVAETSAPPDLRLSEYGDTEDRGECQRPAVESQAGVDRMEDRAVGNANMEHLAAGCVTGPERDTVRIEV